MPHLNQEHLNDTKNVILNSMNTEEGYIALYDCQH